MSAEEARETPRGGGPRPEVSETSLYSYLVTRHTGRAVRMSIQERIVASDGPLVAVLDFRNVAVIDFSCADEVVARLVDEVRSRDELEKTWFFFRGLAEHHLDPVESALVRRTLAVAGESASGEPMLVGSVEREDRAAWRAVQRLGRAGASDVAGEMERAVEEVRGLLDRLTRRRLVVEDRRHYVSLRRTLSDASSDASSDSSSGAPGEREPDGRDADGS